MTEHRYAVSDSPTDTEADDAWGKLRRRKVVQWGIAYGAGAWGLLQGLEYVTDTFDWPNPIQQTATLVLLIGLPIALVIAWYHGDRGEQRVSGIEFAILTALLLLGGGVFAWLGRSMVELRASNGAESAASVSSPASEEVVGGPGPSIAVLPFANMSEDAGNAYFADGLSEELLNLLAKIPQLRVAARTSSFSFKGKDADITTIAQQLNVGHVLEGSVRKVGNRVRITVQLVKSDDGFHVWSETYDRTLDDVFAVQDEIAAAVVGALKLTLLGAPVPTAARTDPEAYALYLRARQAIAEGTADARVRGVELLKQSLEIAPHYARAWDQLARVYGTQTWNSEIPLQAGFASVRAAIERSIAVDPDYAPAYASMADHLMGYERNFVEARQRLQTALRLAPTDPDVLRSAGRFLVFTGRGDESVAIARWLLERDPVNPGMYRTLGFALYWSGQFDAADPVFRREIELQPGTSATHEMLAFIHVLRGDHAVALEEAEKEPNEPMRLTGRALALHGLGRTAESQEVSRKLAHDFPDWGINNAMGYAYRGETDGAFEALERGVREDDPGLTQIRVDPFLKPLHADPRWPKLLEKVGLSDALVADLTLDVELPN